MPEIKLLTDKAKYVPFQNLFDKVIQDGAIAIDQDAYTAALDRVYNVKGLNNMHVEINNTGGANGLTYKIEKCRIKYENDSIPTLDADFDEEIKADTNVAFGAKSITNTIDISPESTAIRIRVKRQSAGDDTTLAGIVNFN